MVLDSVFEREDGASLLMTFKGMREETAAQGALHDSIAKELQGNVVEPFEKWATGHKVRDRLRAVGKPVNVNMRVQDRLLASKANVLEGYIYDYEIGQAEVRQQESCVCSIRLICTFRLRNSRMTT